jgi:hypothetical protein
MRRRSGPPGPSIMRSSARSDRGSTASTPAAGGRGRRSSSMLALLSAGPVAPSRRRRSITARVSTGTAAGLNSSGSSRGPRAVSPPPVTATPFQAARTVSAPAPAARAPHELAIVHRSHKRSRASLRPRRVARALPEGPTGPRAPQERRPIARYPVAIERGQPALTVRGRSARNVVPWRHVTDRTGQTSGLARDRTRIPTPAMSKRGWRRNMPGHGGGCRPGRATEAH